jgi:hypothetical protein
LRESVNHEQRVETPTDQGDPYAKREECPQASEEESRACQEGRTGEENSASEEESCGEESRTSEEDRDSEESTASEEESWASKEGSLARTAPDAALATGASPALQWHRVVSAPVQYDG